MTSALARALVDEVAACARLDPGEVDLDADLVADLGLSSLDVLTVLAFAEGRCGITFPELDLHTLSTVRRIEQAALARRATDEGAMR